MRTVDYSLIGKENVEPEKDVECAHPYFNVHVKSATGDARSLAVQRGSVEFTSFKALS